MADMRVLAIDNSAIIQSLSSARSINSQEKVRVRDSLEAGGKQEWVSPSAYKSALPDDNSPHSFQPMFT